MAETCEGSLAVAGVGRRERAAARELAEAVRDANGRTWRKVTSVLSTFGVSRLTPDVRSRIDEALAAEGIDVEPRFAEVQRYATVRLRDRAVSRPLPPVESAATAEGHPAVISVSLWARGRSHRHVALGAARAPDEVLWVELDPVSA